MDYMLEIKDLETDKHISNMFYNSLRNNVKDIMLLVADRSDMPKYLYGIVWLDNEPVALLDHYGNVTTRKRLNRRKLEVFLG